MSLRTEPVRAETAIKVAAKLDAFVFPTNADKRPITHGKNWQEVSTQDPEAIRRHWKLAGGNAYIGVDCGKSALCVIDIDTPEAVPTALLALLKEHPTLQIMSLTKGQPHYYYRGVCSGRPIPGGDIKATGGYVVCSPDEDLVDNEIADVPDKLIELFDLSLVPSTPPPTRGEPGSPPAIPFDPHDPLATFFATYDTSDLEGSIGQAFLDRVTADTFPNKVKAGMHRRQAVRDVILQAALESAASFYPAEDAYLQIEDTYQEWRDISENPHKRYTPQREADYKTLWEGAAAKILNGYYDVEIINMRSDKGLYEYEPSLEQAPDPDEVPPPPTLEPPEKSEETPEEKPPRHIARADSATDDSKPGVSKPAPPKPDARDSRDAPDSYDPKLEPDWEEATSGKPPAPPPVPTWTDDGIELPTTKRLFREGDYIGEAPKLGAEVFYGNIGEILKVYEGASEAPLPSIGSVLIPLLGSVLGRGVRFRHGDVEHSTNTFWALVAPTGLGRKSTAFRVVKRFFELLEPGFVDSNCLNGFGSGQAIILDLADPVYDSKTGSLKSGREDQRVTLLYEELGSLLGPMGYEGAIISPLLRDAYDQSGPLRYSTMTHRGKVSTNHHLSISAAITPHELQTHFPRLSTADGLGNRFCWVYTDDGSVILPDGGHVDMERLTDIATKVRFAGEFTAYGGAATREVNLSKEVAERWRSTDYPVLRRKGVEAGSLGAMISRQTGHVLRIATIYAVTDGLDEIQMGHYEAGLAWAEYSEATVTALFGEVSRSELANEVLASVREHPGEATTRSGLSKALGYHRTTEQMTAALARLSRAGFVHVWKEADTGKRGPKPEFIIATMPRHK